MALGAIVSFTSCATVGKLGAGSASLMEKTGSQVSKLSEMASNVVNPAGVKVVEVREKDLKPMQTGQERALAYQSSQNSQTSRRSSFSFFRGPVDFKEPNLPDIGGEMDGSLLPPKAP